MRTLLALVVAAIALPAAAIAGAPAPTSAAAGGTTTLTSPPTPTAFEQPTSWGESSQTLSGTFSGRLGSGTYVGTIEFEPFVFPLSDSNLVSPCSLAAYCTAVTGGSITFSSNRGDFTVEVQPGGLLGECFCHPRFDSRTFSVTLLVVGGTRSYAHASGTLSLTYSSSWSHGYVFDGVTLTFVSTVEDTGTLTGNPR